MNDSENIATSGQLLQMVAKFAQVLPLDANRVEVQKVIDDKNDSLWVFLADRFAKKVEEAVETVIQAVKSLKDMIAAGHYDGVNSDINEQNFGPETLIVGNEPKLFHFDRSISSEDAIVEMDKKGFKPGTLGDLLVYGAENPEEQRKYPIVALGSVAVVLGDRIVAYLGRDGWDVGSRDLRLSRFDFGWSGLFRFLAVRK